MPLLGLLTMFTGLAGCEPIVVLDHPLADARTARADNELVGYWKQVPDDAADSIHPVPVTIGLDKSNSRLHEGVFMELEDDGKVKVRRLKIPTTRLALPSSSSPLRLMTVAARDVDPENKVAKGYLLLRYEIQAGQRLKLFLMNSLVIAEAIEAKKLPGVVRRAKPTADGSKLKTKYDEIRITASPAELTAYLKKTGAACFDKKRLIEFQKIVTD
ncbi:MAG: hypothetical protein VB877_15700 [Pirellulaceae bacterium]